MSTREDLAVVSYVSLANKAGCVSVASWAALQRTIEKLNNLVYFIFDDNRLLPDIQTHGETRQIIYVT